MRRRYGAGQHHEERRRVDAAVVAPERHLAAAPPSRRPASRAGSSRAAASRSARRVAAPAWRPGSEARRARSRAAIQSSCSAVMIPSRPNGVLNQGTPGVGIGPIRRLGDHHLQVGRSTASSHSSKSRSMRRPACASRSASCSASSARPRRRATAQSRRTCPAVQLTSKESSRSRRPEHEREANVLSVTWAGARATPQAGAPLDAVQPLIADHDSSRMQIRWRCSPRWSRVPRTSKTSAKSASKPERADRRRPRLAEKLWTRSRW